MSLTQTVPPSGEPVSREEAKTALRVDGSHEDAYIDALIVSARTYAEIATARQLMTATWQLKLDAFPAAVIELPRPPLQAVNWIKYIDAAGVEQTLASGRYLVDTHGEPGRITPAYGRSWPVCRKQLDAVEINYVAGYGGSHQVPQTIKTAIEQLAGHWFKLREPVVTGTTAAKIPLSAESLLLAEGWGGYS